MFLLKRKLIKSDNDTTITITLRDRERSLVRLLQDIKAKANVGHSYEVITDPDDTEHKGQFGIDGDGGFYIKEIREDGKIVKGDKIAHPTLLKSRKLHGSINFQGLDISIETGRSRIRAWHNPHDGSQGMSRMTLPYGYIKGTLGTDGDHVDVFVGPDHSASNVYVVHTCKAPDFTEYDEDKCFIGVNSPEEAKRYFDASYNDPRFYGGMSIWQMDAFKEAIRNHKGKKLDSSIFKDSIGTAPLTYLTPVESKNGIKSGPAALFREDEVRTRGREFIRQQEAKAGRFLTTRELLDAANRHPSNLSKSGEAICKQIGDKLGVDWKEVDLDEFCDGMFHESEHDDVTGGSAEKTAKIVLAHLKEHKRYYSRLEAAGLE